MRPSRSALADRVLIRWQRAAESRSARATAGRSSDSKGMTSRRFQVFNATPRAPRINSCRFCLWTVSIAIPEQTFAATEGHRTPRRPDAESTKPPAETCWCCRAGSRRFSPQQPHARLDTAGETIAPRKQAARMLKCKCQACGYTVRTARKWLETAGAPLCPIAGHGAMHHDPIDGDGDDLQTQTTKEAS